MGIRSLFKKLFCRHRYIKIFPVDIWKPILLFIKGDLQECVKCGRQKGSIRVNIEEYLTNFPRKGETNDGITRKHAGSETNK